MNHISSRSHENIDVQINIVSLSIQILNILKAKKISKYSLFLQEKETFDDMLETITAPDGFLPALAVTADKLWIFLNKSSLGPILQKDADTRTGYRLIGFQSNHLPLILMSIIEVCNLITKDNILHMERLPELNSLFLTSHNDLIDAKESPK